MADTNQIQKVYDLKVTGGDTSYNQLDRINKLFIEMARNKQTLGTININIDATNVNNTTSAFDKLIDSNKELITELKALAGVLREAGQIGGTMISQLAEAFKKLDMSQVQAVKGFMQVSQAMSGMSAGTRNYSLEISRLGAGLAQLKDSAAITQGQMKRLAEEFEQGYMTEEDYNAQMEALTTELQQYKTQITEVTGAMTAMNKTFNSGLLGEEQAALAADKLTLQQRNQLLKLNTIAENASAGSRDAARAQIALLQKELGALNVVTDENTAKILNSNLATDEEIARQKELIATLDTLHDFVRENSDSYTKQKINIGNYPTLRAEFTGLQQQMTELVLAGKADSTEFQELQAQALKLAASMKEVNAAMAQVNAATKEQATVGDKFGSIVEKMGLRMIANVLIFQAAIELAQKLWEMWTADATAAKELSDRMAEIENQAEASAIKENANAHLLANIAKDTGEAMDVRLRAVDELQQKYPDYLGNLSKEALLTGDTADAMKRLNENLLAKAAMEASISKIGELGKKYAELMTQMRTLDSQESNDLGTATDARQKDYIVSHYESEKARISKQIDDIKALNKQYLDDATAFAEQAGELAVGKTKKAREKQPHDNTNAKLEADKKLNNAIAKSSELRIQIEMNEDRIIYENTQNSLTKRLDAYSDYNQRQIELFKIGNSAQVKDVQEKLDKIAEIEKKAPKKRTNEENTLLFNKSELLQQLDVLSSELKLKMQDLGISLSSGISSIVKSSLDKTLDDIKNQTKSHIAQIESDLTDAESKIYSSGKPQKNIDSSISKLEKSASVQKDDVNISGDEQSADAISEAYQQAHNDGLVELEAQLRDKLQGIYEQEISDKKKRDDDLGKKLSVDSKDQVQFKQVADSMMQIAQTAANAYMELLAKQDAYREAMAERSLAFNEKLQDGEAQSNNERLAEQKANMMAEQQLEKQKAEQDKKRAESQIIINAVIAASKAIAERPGPVGIEEAAAIMVMAGIEEAMLATAPTYEFGGNITSSGGVFGGKSHASGGTPFAYGGSMHEAEAGEISIVNRKSAGSNQQMTVTGTPKQIASAINTHGGGINFAPGAVMHKYEWGGMLGAQIQPPAFLTNHFSSSSLAAPGMDRMHELMKENTKALNDHANEMSSRFDRIQVQLNPHDVTDYQNNHKKSVKLGSFNH